MAGAAVGSIDMTPRATKALSQCRRVKPRQFGCGRVEHEVARAALRPIAAGVFAGLEKPDGVPCTHHAMLGVCATEVDRSAKPSARSMISADSWPIAVLWVGESSKTCPRAADFSPRSFPPRRLLAGKRAEELGAVGFSCERLVVVVVGGGEMMAETRLCVDVDAKGQPDFRRLSPFLASLTVAG